MQALPDMASAASDLAEVGRHFHARGWLPATSGNLSARLDPCHMAITASGRDKGRLRDGDFLIAGLDGTAVAAGAGPSADARPSAGARPSAEARLHAMVYGRDPRVGAVLHTHSRAATVLSRRHPDGVRLADYELLKALAGVQTHAAAVLLPVFPNDQDMARLASLAAAYLDRHPDTLGFLIAGHGLYAWGADIAEAARHVEALEFLLDCELTERR